MMPVALDLPGPSRRVRIEPLRLPVPDREPARDRPAEPAPQPEPERAPVAPREPAPA